MNTGSPAGWAPLLRPIRQLLCCSARLGPSQLRMSETPSKPPSRQAKPGAASDLSVVAPSVAKAVGGLVPVPGVGAFVGLAADSWKEHAARARDAMRQQADQQLGEFFRYVLSAPSSMDEQVARAMMDDKDFHALLRACVADIEAEKVRVYATMARGIACGSVPKSRRRHFILWLRDLSADELETLRGAFVAKSHRLIGPQGNNSIGQSHFLKRDPITLVNLSTRGLVQDGDISDAGIAFVAACYGATDLTPASLGRQTWSGHHAGIITYELAKEVGGTGNLFDNRVDPLWERIQEGLKQAAVASSVFAIVRDNVDQARGLCSLGVLVVRAPDSIPSDCLPHLAKFAATVPTVLVDLGGAMVEVPGVRLLTRLNAATMKPPAIVDGVRELVAGMMSREIATARTADPASPEPPTR